jgi:hypothetical protein
MGHSTVMEVGIGTKKCYRIYETILYGGRLPNSAEKWILTFNRSRTKYFKRIMVIQVDGFSDRYEKKPANGIISLMK